MFKIASLFIIVLSFSFTTKIYCEERSSVAAEAEFENTETNKENSVNNKLGIFGDIRLRAEEDWNSRRFDGTFREDRFRLRYRLRFGMQYDWNQYISIGFRLRSGVPESLQSAHINFGYREFTGFPIRIDRAYLSAKYNEYWGWAGKNNFPFWKQNELFWDDDVTPEGIALGGDFKFEEVEIKPKLGYFITNTGRGDFDPTDPSNGRIDGHMAGGQLEVGLPIKNHNITIASAFYSLKNINNVPVTDFLYAGNRFKLDYSFIVSGLKFIIDVKYPITIGIDHFINLEDYEGIADTLIDPVYKDQKNGFVLSAQVGKLNQKGDWLVAYYFARKEEFSVVSYYTEDDWVRLGNINRNRNTNYQGHEIRAAYAFDSRFNIVARAYFIKGLVTPGTHTESGNRFRLDLNMKFHN